MCLDLVWARLRVPSFHVPFRVDWVTPLSCMIHGGPLAKSCLATYCFATTQAVKTLWLNSTRTWQPNLFDVSTCIPCPAPTVMVHYNLWTTLKETLSTGNGIADIFLVAVFTIESSATLLERAEQILIWIVVPNRRIITRIGAGWVGYRLRMPFSAIAILLWRCRCSHAVTVLNYSSLPQTAAIIAAHPCSLDTAGCK